MNRRIFLRGLGGACVAAPFLGSLTGRGVKANEATPPRRFIAMFTHAGCITNRFFPASSHGPLTEADLEAKTLRHLAPYVQKLLLPRGIRAMNEWTSTMERGQGNDPHLNAVGSYFTCQPVTPNSNDPFSFDNATKFQAKPIGPSLDHVMAAQLSPGGAPLLMRVGNHNDSPYSAISYSAAETPYPGSTLVQAFAGLTGLFAGGPVTPDSYKVARGKSVLDVVKDDLATLERFDMSRSDKMKLNAWKELLNQTVVITRQCNEATATALGATQANVDAVVPGAVGSDTDILTTKVNGTTLDGADIYSNVAVLAAVCNANPVVFLKYPFAYAFKGLGLQSESESLAHRIGNAGTTGNCVAGVVDMLLKIDDFYARKFAHLVGLLDSVEEGDGTVLDNTAAVWFQSASDGAAHNLNNMPIVQAGSAGGYFKTGLSVNVESGTDDPRLLGRSEAVCNSTTDMIVTGTETGTVPAAGNAPINKYYVNLMNALGVKAGADGFPLKGGTEEVAKFGRYDRTQDFVGGSVNPPTITSPGGFEALKA